MDKPLYSIGIDISTQTISAALIKVTETDSWPQDITISTDWRVSRQCSGETERKTPAIWVELVRELIADLKKSCAETFRVRSIGVSTTFPGVFAIMRDGSTNPCLASLYDNTEDAGVCSGAFDNLLTDAEQETLNRMWPGNMAIGLVQLIKLNDLKLDEVGALVPPNTAFAHGLLRSAGQAVEPRELPSDYTETIIGGLYNARTAQTIPAAVARLVKEAVPNLDVSLLRNLLPRAEPSWRNVVPESALAAVRDLLGLPELVAVSIGAGDSPLGALALCPGYDTVLNVRGSSDSPMIMIDTPGKCPGPRETVLHYPFPTVASAEDSPWCAVAPMLRSGKVWDWVKRLRFQDNDPKADAELEKLATEALKRRLTRDTPAIIFDTALGGERSPDWDSNATGCLTGLVEAHTLGDIALAALEGLSLRLRACIEQMESRYDVEPPNLLLAGGPVKNKLWNWVTSVIVGKKTFITEFCDASLLGSAMLGYASLYDGREPDRVISQRLHALSKIAARHPLVRPIPVAAPDEELARLESAYVASLRRGL